MTITNGEHTLRSRDSVVRDYASPSLGTTPDTLRFFPFNQRHGVNESGPPASG